VTTVGHPLRLPAAGAARRLAALICTLALAACATIPAVAPDRVYSGRFSAVAAQGERREAVSGRFTMEVRGAERTIDLATPLGSTVARIEVGADGARATGPGMQEARGPDPDALAEQLLGWRLPVSGLADWVEGRPAPGRPARVERNDGRPVLIEQDGWIVQLAEAFPATGKPRRIVLERSATPIAPAVVLRLVIDDPAG
jgi:outer membrane lipoprotein LolB